MIKATSSNPDIMSMFLKCQWSLKVLNKFRTLLFIINERSVATVALYNEYIANRLFLIIQRLIFSISVNSSNIFVQAQLNSASTDVSQV